MGSAVMTEVDLKKDSQLNLPCLCDDEHRQILERLFLDMVNGTTEFSKGFFREGSE